MRKKILVLGGTRYFGKHLVTELLNNNHDVTIATRGISSDDFDNCVQRIIFDRYDKESIEKKIGNIYFDVVVDMLAYSSFDVAVLFPFLNTNKYIVVSSTMVYENLIGEVVEGDFDPHSYEYIIEKRDKNNYSRGKRLVESALTRVPVDYISVRFPFVVGPDDYTKRLYKYIDSFIIEEKMYIDNLHECLSFVSSYEAGKFLAFLVETEKFTGFINGASKGEISLYEILNMVDNKTNDEKIIDLFSDSTSNVAPFNGIRTHSINTQKANLLGYEFSHIDEWINDLIKELVRESRLKKFEEHS